MEEKYIQMIVENAQSTKSAHHRIDKLENDISEIKELTIAVKEIALETKANREDVNKIDSRLEAIEKKPATKWEDLKKTIITRDCNSNPGILISEVWILKNR